MFLMAECAAIVRSRGSPAQPPRWTECTTNRISHRYPSVTGRSARRPALAAPCLLFFSFPVSYDRRHASRLGHGYHNTPISSSYRLRPSSSSPPFPYPPLFRCFNLYHTIRACSWHGRTDERGARPRVASLGRRGLVIVGVIAHDHGWLVVSA
ncbi:hypothetical protein GGS23DRAFT_286048 [Durotheca rogersii]|uniref:uncharacterized protein n=1 Tax=Durotheca rogersii TaxID=419775 RepID=UPI00222074FB|nr:uncharacterized protein GGS23DRAFT_286048 [Durotheca rogersii]KAI5866750.1 hypothetical protein GGS23DRAFT_286048 [Durotheca rogersii]